MEGAPQNVEQEARNGGVDGPISKPFIGAVTENTFVQADAAHGFQPAIL